MSGPQSSSFDIALSTLRDTDRDRYLACLLSPAEKRDALVALYAFNAELARIRDLVRDALPGEVRLQYWRDLLEGTPRGSSEANPLAAALLSTIDSYQLPRASLIAMTEARIFDLYDDPMESRIDLEGYAGETASALIQLASLVLNADRAADSAGCAGHAGVAQTIAGLLLLMPLHRHRGQLYIPVEILTATGLDRDSFLAGADKARISAAIEAFAGLGLDHLAQAQREQGRVSRSIFPAFLPVSLAEPVLRRAQKVGAGLFDAPLAMAQLRRQWRLATASLRHRF